MRFFLISILLFLSLISFSQYKLLLLGGDTLNIQNYKLNDLGTAINFHNPQKEIVEIDLDYIFSIKDTAGNETIIYKPDTSKDDFMNVDQMRLFIYGEQDAIKKYKCRWCFVGGIIIGAASPFVTPLLGIRPIIYSPLLPAIGSSVVGFTSPGKKKIAKYNSPYIESEFYIQGFKEVASQKRLKSGVIGSGIGLVVGIITAIIIDSTK